MRKLLLLSLTILAFNSYGQEKIVFKSFYKPGKVYNTSITTSNESEIDFSGNQEKIDGIKANGIKLPMIVYGTNEMSTIITTGTVMADKSFPVRMIYEKAITTQIVNDKETKEEKPISGLIVEGYYNAENKLQIDTIISDKIDENTKRIVKSTIENLQEQIKFPEGPMQVGDSFDQKIPMEFPMAGLKPIKLVVTTNYKLKNINNGKATFDLVQTVTLEMEKEEANISAYGDGTGISEFDIVNSIITRYESDIRTNMKMTIDDLILSAKMNIKTKQLVTVD